jgi:hypothetical protein
MPSRLDLRDIDVCSAVDSTGFSHLHGRACVPFGEHWHLLSGVTPSNPDKSSPRLPVFRRPRKACNRRGASAMCCIACSTEVGIRCDIAGKGISVARRMVDLLTPRLSHIGQKTSIRNFKGEWLHEPAVKSQHKRLGFIREGAAHIPLPNRYPVIIEPHRGKALKLTGHCQCNRAIFSPTAFRLVDVILCN